MYPLKRSCFTLNELTVFWCCFKNISFYSVYMAGPLCILHNLKVVLAKKLHTWRHEYFVYLSLKFVSNMGVLTKIHTNNRTSLTGNKTKLDDVLWFKPIKPH